MRNRISFRTALCTAALILMVAMLGAGTALAQTGTTDTPAPAQAAPAQAAPAQAAPVLAQPAQPAGSLRQQCESALINDAQWRAELKQQLAAEVHAEDANQMLTNRKHVVMAYAALWILVALFVVFMWLKQKDLKTEIARLEREVRAATQDSDSKAG
jgi:cell division protein FtsL